MKVQGETHVLAAPVFTRPADTTAYASGDLVANSTTAGSVVPLVFTKPVGAAPYAMIRRARLRKSSVGVTSSSFRLHLFRAAPTPANGDNGVFSTTGVADYIGAMDIIIDRAFTDGAAGQGVPLIGSEINTQWPASGMLYGLLEARGAYTPVSAETVTAVLEIVS